jgi:hypothetical protein
MAFAFTGDRPEFWLEVTEHGMWARIDRSEDRWKQIAVKNAQHFRVTDTITMWWHDDPAPPALYNHAAIAIVRACGYDGLEIRGHVIFTGLLGFTDGQQTLSLEDEALICAYANHCKSTITLSSITDK